MSRLVWPPAHVCRGLGGFSDPLKKNIWVTQVYGIYSADFLTKTENERFIYGFGVFAGSARLAVIP
jgi:hypothetical protein